MTVHLATRGGSVCGRVGRNGYGATHLGVVTCSWCLHKLEHLTLLEAEAAAERARLTQAAADCEAVGISHLWAAVEDDTPTGRMLRDTLAAVARYFVESDTAPVRHLRAAP